MKKQQNMDAKEIEDLELETLDAIFKGQKEKVKKLYGKTERLFNKGLKAEYSRQIYSSGI